MLVKRYLVNAEEQNNNEMNGVDIEAVQEITLHSQIATKCQPNLIQMVQFMLKSNGLVTVTEHYEKTLAMAFEESIT